MKIAKPAGAPPDPKALTRDEVSALRHAPPAVKRVLLHIASHRLLHGEGPTLGSVWGLYYHNDANRRPSHKARKEVAVTRGDGSVRTFRRTEADDARALLGELYPYGVRWTPNVKGSLRLKWGTYTWLRTIVVHQLTQEGRWPVEQRYHGTKSVVK